MRPAKKLNVPGTNADGLYPEPRLCYVHPDGPVAFFSRNPNVWGDDWDDSPYEHNAGPPCEWSTRVVFLDAELDAPCTGQFNSRYSVEQINARMVPWLRSSYKNDDGEYVVVHAGATVDEFIAAVHRAGGVAMVVPERKEHGND